MVRGESAKNDKCCVVYLEARGSSECEINGTRSVYPDAHAMRAKHRATKQIRTPDTSARRTMRDLRSAVRSDMIVLARFPPQLHITRMSFVLSEEGGGQTKRQF